MPLVIDAYDGKNIAISVIMLHKQQQPVILSQITATKTSSFQY